MKRSKKQKPLYTEPDFYCMTFVSFRAFMTLWESLKHYQRFCSTCGERKLPALWNPREEVWYVLHPEESFCSVI